MVGRGERLRGIEGGHGEVDFQGIGAFGKGELSAAFRAEAPQARRKEDGRKLAVSHGPVPRRRRSPGHKGRPTRPAAILTMAVADIKGLPLDPVADIAAEATTTKRIHTSILSLEQLPIDNAVAVSRLTATVRASLRAR